MYLKFSDKFKTKTKPIGIRWKSISWFILDLLRSLPNIGKVGTDPRRPSVDPMSKQSNWNLRLQFCNFGWRIVSKRWLLVNVIILSLLSLLAERDYNIWSWSLSQILFTKKTYLAKISRRTRIFFFIVDNKNFLFTTWMIQELSILDGNRYEVYSYSISSLYYSSLCWPIGLKVTCVCVCVCVCLCVKKTDREEFSKRKLW